MDGALCREGDVWAVQLDGRVARVRDSRGLHHLAVLLARPGTEVHAIELAGAPEAAGSASAGPLLDDRARTAYKQRLTDLAGDLDEATSFNDTERAAAIQAEIDALVDQLTAATGLGGRDRGAISDAERARVSVRRAIKSALDRIAEAHPPLGAHLAATIRTGTYCAYVPDPVSPVRWTFGDEPVAAVTPVTPAPATRPARPLVVGRAPEQSILGDAWQAARAGAGRVVTVCGEPGIGKTTLLRDLAATTAGDGGATLHGRCDEHVSVPYQPVIEIVRALTEVDGAATIAADATVGAGVLGRLVPELGTDVPAGDAPETERLLLFDAAARVVRAAATRRPIVITVDDLHWAQPPTLALLLHLVRDIAGSAVTAVLTYRDTEVGDDLASFLAALGRAVDVERVGLVGIDVDAIVELGASPDDAKRIVEHTGGNPFFVRALLDAPLAESLPPSVLDVLDDRVRRLSPDARRLVGLVAVAGERVPARVAASLAGSIDPIDEALDAGLLFEDGPTLAFPHALVRRAITERSSGVRRAALHLEVARALEAAGAPAAQLAHHYVEAASIGDIAAATHWSLEAADIALNTYAFEEAMAHARRGLDVTPEGSLNAAQLLLRLASAQHSLGDVGNARATLDGAAQIALAAGDVHLIADIALERGYRGAQFGVHEPDVAADLQRAIELLGDTDADRRARLLGRLAVQQSGAGRLDEARALAAEAVELARRSGEPSMLLNALRAQHHVSDAPEHLGQRGAIAREYDALAREHGDVDHRITAVATLMMYASETGDIDALDRYLAELHDLTRQIGTPKAEWFDLEQQVLRAVIAGDIALAEELADRELTVGTAASVPNALRGYSLQLFVIRLEQGREGELADLAMSMAAGEDGAAVTSALAALACVGAGRGDEARTLLTGIDFGALPRDTVLLGVLAAGAELVLRLGDVERAAVVDQQLRPFAGRNISIALGTITIGPVDRYLSFTARALGDVERARAHLEAAIALDEKMRATRWLERDRNDLAALTGAARN